MIPLNALDVKDLYKNYGEFKAELFSCIGEMVYALELLPGHKPSSKAFDLATIPDVPKKKYIPPMSHPWKQASFEKYAKSQAHRKDVA